MSILGKSLCIYCTKVKGEEPHKTKQFHCQEYGHTCTMYIHLFPAQWAICGILYPSSDHTKTRDCPTGYVELKMVARANWHIPTVRLFPANKKKLNRFSIGM